MLCCCSARSCIFVTCRLQLCPGRRYHLRQECKCVIHQQHSKHSITSKGKQGHRMCRHAYPTSYSQQSTAARPGEDEYGRQGAVGHEEVMPWVPPVRNNRFDEKTLHAPLCCMGVFVSPTFTRDVLKDQSPAPLLPLQRRHGDRRRRRDGHAAGIGSLEVWWHAEGEGLRRC